MGSKSVEEYERVEVIQAITFIGIIVVSYLAVKSSDFLRMDAWSWILLGMLIVHFGLWLYALTKYGFRKSIHFIKIFAIGKGGRGGGGK